MNSQALYQLFHTGIQMFDAASKTVQELSLFYSNQKKLEHEEDDEFKKRKRRLKALRWSLLFAVSYSSYKLVYKLMSGRNRRSRVHSRMMGTINHDSQNYRLGYGPQRHGYSNNIADGNVHSTMLGFNGDRSFGDENNYDLYNSGSRHYNSYRGGRYGGNTNMMGSPMLHY